VGYLNAEKPVIWVRIPMVRVIDGDLSNVGPGEWIAEDADELGQLISEHFVTLDEYYRQFSSHREEKHVVIEATDPLCYRLAFVCATCRQIVGADWDECIALACVLERSVEEAETRTVSFLEG
jgi:hypothetical protein